MMWDLSGGQSQPRSIPRSVTPMAMPSPAFPTPQYEDIMRGPSSFPGMSHMPSAMPAPAMSPSGHLMPMAPIPVGGMRQTSDSMVYTRHRHTSSTSHHHHHHHESSGHHKHHRVHSNPTPPKPILVTPAHSHHSHQHHQSQPHVTIAPSTPKPSASRPTHAAYHPEFQYSKCTGKKKALCIGINYRGQPNELRGCINDARGVKDFLIRNAGYRERDIVMLTDDSHNPRALPTRKNIIDAMHWLVSGAKTHDSLFFHYSGHGGQTPDKNGDEVDGYDEVIFPMDYKKRGHILDDEMHAIMVHPLPKGCRLTALFDSCHSGTVLDLPFIYSSHGRLKGSHVTKRALARLSTPADVISWSGCQDGQTSADTFHGGVAVGAMSHAFIYSMRQNPRQTYQQLLKSVRALLYPKFSQKPQLGSSHHIDTNLQFII